MGYSRDDYLNKTEVREAGFTEKMIRDLLPEPTERANPRYRSASPMKLWPKSVVAEVMKTEAYREAAERAESRRRAASKAVETKREATRRKVDQAIGRIHVERPGWATRRGIIRAGVEHREDLDFEHGEYGIDRRNADRETEERWAVNFIRHRLTDYEDDLFSMKGDVGNRDEYQRYKGAVLDAIAEAYPFLRDECERQKNPPTPHCF